MVFDKRLVIMLTSQNGTKHINVSMVFRQIALYVILFSLSVLLFIIFSLIIFRAEISDINSKVSLLEEYNETMLLGNAALNEEFSQKLGEMAMANEKVGSLEDAVGVGLTNTDDEDIFNRIDTASVTAAQKAFFMKFIPNGYPLPHFAGLTDSFGIRYHPILKIVRRHTGVDFVARLGTSVYATADGVVSFADSGWNGGYGKLIKITHSFGFKTFYAHLGEILVENGSFVKKGQIIAKSGNTGISTGPHLHYEVRFLEQPINPVHFARWDMKDFDSIFKKERSIQWQSLLTTINNLME